MRIALSESKEDDESDDYLIELMGLKTDFPKEAMEAYGKIYSRYWSVMYEIAKGVTNDEDNAMDLLSDTFNMVYNKAATFKKGKIANPENIRFSIQKWMTTIMKRIFYDHFLNEDYKKSSESDKLEESYIIEKRFIGRHFSDDYYGFIEQLEQDEVDARISVITEDEDSNNIARVKEYIDKLSERDRDIILTFYNHYVPGKYTPGTVLDDLIKKWETTRENIRKILEKFRRSIKEELQPKLFIRK